MDSRKKFMKILAVGLFFMSGSELIRILIKNIINENLLDFINGFMKGLGIVLIIWATYRMRRPNTAC